VVAKGRKPGLMACAFCHLPTGDGQPENAVLAGLPRDHIIEQMRTFRDGTRRSSVVTRYPTILMTVVVKAATDAEIVAAADYFSSLEHHAFAEFVKTDRVPRTQTRGWVYSPRFEGYSESIGAYAPVGSVTRGERLAGTRGGAGQQACASCHGHDLRGIGQAPPLAGRSPNLYCSTTQRSESVSDPGPKPISGVEPQTCRGLTPVGAQKQKDELASGCAEV
jgi:cytochrome c553